MPVPVDGLAAMTPADLVPARAAMPCDACRQRQTLCTVLPSSTSCMTCLEARQACTFGSADVSLSASASDPSPNTGTGTATRAAINVEASANRYHP